MYKIKELVFISTILIICVTIFSGCEYLEKLERMEGEKKHIVALEEEKKQQKEVMERQEYQKVALGNYHKNLLNEVKEKKLSLEKLENILNQLQADINSGTYSNVKKQMEKKDAEEKINNLANRIDEIKRGDTSKLEEETRKLDEEMEALIEIMIDL